MHTKPIGYRYFLYNIFIYLIFLYTQYLPDSFDATVNLFSGIRHTKCKTHGSLRIRMESLMCHRCTVKPHPCHDAVLLFQFKCHHCIVCSFKVQRDHGHTVSDILFPGDPDSRKLLHTFQKILWIVPIPVSSR